MLGIMLVDMQEKFIDYEKKNLVKSQKRLLDFAIRRNIPIFMLEYEGYGTTLPELKKVARKKENCYIISKKNENGFKENKLLNILKENKIGELILAGVYKWDCMEKTAEGGKENGIEIFTSDELMDDSEHENPWYSKNTHHYKRLTALLKKVKLKSKSLKTDFSKPYL